MVNAIIKKHFIQIIQLNVLIEMPGIRCYQWANKFDIFGIWLHLVYGIASHVCTICNKESGRIRRRFGRNVGIKQRLKIIDDSYAFSNAIRLIVFLITGKFVKFYQNVFSSSKYGFE